MMNNKIMDILLVSSLINKGNYGINYIYDQEVNDCIMNMYFYMLYSNVNEEKKEEYLNEFEKSYNTLNKEQQRIVKDEYINIIETQNKNREKVKRKGMNDYE